MLIPERAEIEQFVGAIFRYADDDSFISLRAFDQSDRGQPPQIIQGIRVGSGVVDAAATAAQRAANSPRPSVFAPPVATFRVADKARTSDLANGVAISVEMDSGDTKAAMRRLEHLLGPCTVVVASGGQWVDPQTGEIHDKLHLHWRLSEPTRSADDHERLRAARQLAAMLVGGDPTAAPPAHPLRWPGSWNLKGSPRLAMICGGNQAAEVHLADAIEKLQEAVEQAGLLLSEAPRSSGTPTAQMARVADAMRSIPNPDLHWDQWNRMGMALYRASGGAQSGLDAWDDWSARSSKHVAGSCAERWQHYATSPPTSIGAGTIFFIAKAEGWQPAPPEPPRAPDDAGYWASVETDAMSAPEVKPTAPPKQPIADNALPIEYFSDVTAAVETHDFVEGLFVERSMAVVYGKSNSGKTFFVFDIAMHVALGWQWGAEKREVTQGAILWVAMEGAFGIRNRIAAFKAHHNLHGVDVPFAVIPLALNLLDPNADTDRLIAAVQTASQGMGCQVKWIIVDTLARAMAGGNENAPDDMGALITNGTRLQQATHAAVTWIHHSGKDEARGARGHTSLLAATDTEIEIAADGGARVARVTKQREMECAGEFTFTLKVVELGINTRGKPVTSCVVETGDVRPPGGAPIGRGLTGHNKRALEVLTDLIASAGRSGDVGTPSGCLSVPEKWWRDRFYERAMPGAEQEAKQKGFRRAAGHLVEVHIVGMGGGRVWIIAGHPPGHPPGHGSREPENRDTGD